jgi:type II secretory pathway pseudopilin PulG
LEEYSHKESSKCSGEAGTTLIEVIVATLVMVIGVVSMAQLFAISTGSNVAARNNTFAAVLAEQKVEQLRSLTWGFDPQGIPLSDFATDTSEPDATPTGMGLQPSPASALQTNTVGYVDHVAANGVIVGNQVQAPATAIYTRRWSIEPLPTNPNNTLIIQVLVTPNRNRGQADQGAVGRLPDEARVITVKTRKAQ